MRLFNILRKIEQEKKKELSSRYYVQMYPNLEKSLDVADQCERKVEREILVAKFGEKSIHMRTRASAICMPKET